MELKIDQEILNQVNISLQNIPKYNLANFVDDSVQIDTMLNSELRSISDFKNCINKLRSLLRDNIKIFCALFQNIIVKYLLILENENVVPDEYIFLLFDILHNRENLKKKYEVWIEYILKSLMLFSWNHLEQNNEGQVGVICKLVSVWFDHFINLYSDSINNFIIFFDSIGTNSVKMQKISAFFFFKYIYLYDINKINLINWKFFFKQCTEKYEKNIMTEENKNVINDIFQQIFKYFQKMNIDPNDVLTDSNSLLGAKYFEKLTGYNTSKARENIRLIEDEISKIM